MSQLLRLGRRAPANVWQVELDREAEKLDKYKAELADKEALAADPTRDSWFGDEARAFIELLVKNIKVQTAVVEAVTAKLAEAKAARPAALKAAAEAQRARDQLADKIKARYDELAYELADLHRQAADVEVALRDAAATGEAKDIDPTSPWDRAKSPDRKPLVVQGRGSAPDVRIVTLDGTDLWPVAPAAPLTRHDLPATVTVKNTGRQPAVALLANATPFVVQPGDSITACDLPIESFLGSLSVELSVA